MPSVEPCQHITAYKSVDWQRARQNMSNSVCMRIHGKVAHICPTRERSVSFHSLIADQPFTYSHFRWPLFSDGCSSPQFFLWNCFPLNSFLVLMYNIIFYCTFKSIAMDRQGGQRKILDRQSHFRPPFLPVKKTNVYFPQNITGRRFYSSNSWFFIIPVRNALRHSIMHSLCDADSHPKRKHFSLTLPNSSWETRRN